MSVRRILEQISHTGTAQVIVVLKDAQPPAAPGKFSAALSAAIPVAASRAIAGVAESMIMGLAKHFRTSEASEDAALATSLAVRGIKSAGVGWFKRAKVASDPTPPVRYFPHLGLMLGTVDKQGIEALNDDDRVNDVLAPPVLSLIRPVREVPVKKKATAAAQVNWGIKRLKVDQLHDRGIAGQGIIVGHLDTGADGQHPALKDAFQSFAEFDDLGFQITPTPAPHDTGDHGTHTAGTIAGRISGKRAIGVAPEALLASAIVIEGGNVTARILAGMDWIIGEGARILNMSLGLRGFHEDFLAVTQTLRQRGVLPVFAVGNEGPGTSRSPGNYVEALSVGAIDADDRVPDFSSSQTFDLTDNPVTPDLVAPGAAIISAMPDGGFQEKDGSSMATPHISGLAALLMQAAPAATIDQIEAAIFDSCTVLPDELADRQNRGVPDAVKALQLLGVSPPAAGDAPPPRSRARRTGRRGSTRRRGS
jgi:subtilisin